MSVYQARFVRTVGEGVDEVLGCAPALAYPGAGGPPDAVLALDGDPAPRQRLGLPRREALGPAPLHVHTRRLVDSIPVGTVTV